jgi:predicted CXXCH cytochrome family protein
VVRGDGAVPRVRCLSCHNQADRLAKFDDPGLLHLKHVTEHKVDCVNCHLVIEHGLSPPGAITADAGECKRCHGSGHSPQADLYSGRGGRGVPEMPSPMFAAGVGCDGCHNPQYSATPASTGGTGVHSVSATVVSCMACHGPAYQSIYSGWKQGVTTRLAALRAQLDQTVPAFGIAGPAAFEDARHNYLLVESGRGVHNVGYAYALLDKAHDLMNQARRSKGLAPLPRPWTVIAPGSGSCLSCHAGVEKQAGSFAGRAFPHGPHLVAAKLECAACHRPHAERAPGEVVRFGEAGCISCHHQGAITPGPACAKCHGDVTARTLPSWRGEFSHKAHLEQGLECATCHESKGGDPRPQRSVCAQCHV